MKKGGKKRGYKSHVMKQLNRIRVLGFNSCTTVLIYIQYQMKARLNAYEKYKY